MKRFADRLLTWYERDKRDLPWRRAADPWATWVSEVMLQQTRVEVVRQIFPRFLERFPSPADLAQASDDRLLAAWRGLGYYRRVRALREAARQVVARHGGRVPGTAEELRELPGIGLYTAGAIASIAFGQPEPAIDGNVERVVARHRGIEAPIKARPGAAAVEAFVREQLPRERAGDFNQALMELGATVCTPRSPRCDRCPVRTDCVARGRGNAEELPNRPGPRRAIDVVARAVLVPVPGRRVLGSRIHGDAINGGQVDLPGPGVLTTVATARALAGELKRLYGVSFQVGPVVTTVHHAITHHRIRLAIHQATCSHGPGPNLMAARPDDTRIPWSTVARKAFQQAALFLASSGRDT